MTAVAVGGLLVAAGTLGLLGFVLTGVVSGLAGGADPSVTSIGGGALLAIVFGTAMTAAGMGVRGPDIGARRPASLLVALVGFLLLGHVVGQAGGLFEALVFPAINVATALIAAMALLIYVAWAGLGVRLVPGVAGLGMGGCLVALAAIIAELIVGAVILVVVIQVFMSDAAMADVAAAAQALGESGRTGEPPDPDLLATILHPALVGGVFLLFGLLGPLIEEVLKGVGALALRPRSRWEAWWWGVSVGAGFGVIEAVTFSAMAGEAWAVTMLVRVLSMLMHATLSGLMTLGLYDLLEGRRTFGLVGPVLAVIGHALWNSLVLAAVLSIVTMSQGTEPGIGFQAAVAILFILFAAILLAFRGLSRRLGREARDDVPPLEPVPG